MFNHTLHWYGVCVVWILSCSCRAWQNNTYHKICIGIVPLQCGIFHVLVDFPFCVNHLSHVLHWYGFSPVRDLSWVWRPPFWVKAIFTSSWLVWLLSCVGSHMHFYISFFEETTHHMFCSGRASGFFHVFVESLSEDTNLSHLLHCYNFSTVWDLLWTCRSLFWITHLSHEL